MKEHIHKKKIDSLLWNRFSSHSTSNTYLYISTIKIDEKIASGVISMVSNNIIYYILPAYDIKYKKYSIGIHHLNKIINFAQKNGYLGIDLTIGDEPYKLKFHTDKYPLYSSFYTNNIYLKPLTIFLILFYKLINMKSLKFIFKSIKQNIIN